MSTAPAVVGPWARDKLAALARYLNFYTTALKHQPWKTLYVDAYAGGGRAIVRAPGQQADHGQLPLLESGQTDEDEAELINGSPRVALGIDTPFDDYVFIEPDARRHAELLSLKQEASESMHITVRDQTAREGLRWILTRTSKKSHRGIVFLDPFGADLEWDTIRSLGNSGYIEVIINFALHMGIQRMLPNSGNLNPEWKDRLDRYFGTVDWWDHVYLRSDPNLFGQDGVVKRADYHMRLLELYQNRLIESFGHVSTPKLIRNTKGVPLYYLLWAGPNPLGLKGADHILRMGEPLPKGRQRA